jgi:hypothetical protein
VTVIECTNAAGWALPLCVIFKGKVFIESWFDGLPDNWRFEVSPNRWTSDEIGLRWLEIKTLPLKITHSGRAQPAAFVHSITVTHSRFLGYKWFDGLPDNWRFEVSPNRWTSDEIGLRWLEKLFIPHLLGLTSNRQLSGRPSNQDSIKTLPLKITHSGRAQP